VATEKQTDADGRTSRDGSVLA